MVVLKAGENIGDSGAAGRLRRVFASLERAVATEARRHFGEALHGVLVFGSVGRGTMRADSDLDMLFVVEGLPDSPRARMRLIEPVEKALAVAFAEAKAEDVTSDLSPVMKTPEEMEEGFLLLLDMTEDGRVLWERDGCLTRWLAAFRERLRRAGARRLRHGGSWYWDLKPGLRPGDRVQI